MARWLSAQVMFLVLAGIRALVSASALRFQGLLWVEGDGPTVMVLISSATPVLVGLKKK
ncbi:hypothetical protein LINPERPRIM_LOCUS6745 [Linum perenne]